MSTTYALQRSKVKGLGIVVFLALAVADAKELQVKLRSSKTADELQHDSTFILTMQTAGARTLGMDVADRERVDVFVTASVRRLAVANRRLGNVFNIRYRAGDAEALSEPDLSTHQMELLIAGELKQAEFVTGTNYGDVEADSLEALAPTLGEAAVSSEAATPLPTTATFIPMNVPSTTIGPLLRPRAASVAHKISFTSNLLTTIAIVAMAANSLHM